MATFATTTTLDTNMIGITFDNPTDRLAENMILRAENEIKKYLSNRYDLSGATFQTTVSVPPLVRSLCEDLAEGYMWHRMGRGSKESLKRGDDLIKHVTDNLKMICDYKLHLTDTAGSLITDFSNSSYAVRSNTDDYVTTFNEDDPLNWGVSGSKLDDISDDRDADI